MRKKSEDKMQMILDYVNQYYESNFSSPSLRLIAKNINISRQTVLRYLKYMDELGFIKYDGKSIITDQIKEAMHNDVKRIAICGNIVCGEPLFEEENILDYIYLPNQLLGEGHFYALRAYGDSMTEAGIDENDVVIIRNQEVADVGQIVVVLDEENHNTLKRLLHDGNRYYLHPENKDYEDLYPDEIKIQGIAVKIIKDIR